MVLGEHGLMRGEYTSDLPEGLGGAPRARSSDPHGGILNTGAELRVVSSDRMARLRSQVALKTIVALNTRYLFLVCVHRPF